MTNRHIGKLLAFKFEYANETVVYKGYLIDFNEDWVLLKYNTGDYLVDGYIVLRNKHITHYRRSERERFIQKILDLKGQQSRKNEIIPITDLATILNHLTEQYGCFQFSMRVSDTSWLGKVRKISGSNLDIDYLTPKARWTKEIQTYKLGNIRAVEFDTDYINSLMLIAGKKSRKRK